MKTKLRLKLHNFPLHLHDSPAFNKLFWNGLDRIITNYISNTNREGSTIAVQTGKPMPKEGIVAVISIKKTANGLFDWPEQALQHEVGDFCKVVIANAHFL